MFIFSYFIRLSTGVLGPTLMKDLGIDAGQLGLLAGALFYAFAIAQLPIGLALDSFSPKLVIISTTLLAILGCFLFGVAEGFKTALLSRILIGLGISTVLMGSLKIFDNWFRPDEFGFLSGLMLSLGNFGALIAATPLVFMANALGWRRCFIFFSIFATLSAFLIILIVRDYPPEKRRNKRELNSRKISTAVFHPLALVFSNRDFWFIAISCFLRFGVLIGIQGFVGTLYLVEVLGYNLQESGNILSMLSLGYLIGSPIVGRLSDVVFRSRKKVVLVTLFLFAVSTLPFLFKETRAQILWHIVFFGLGFFGSVGSVNFAHVKELFPQEMVGSALAGVNLFCIGGIGVGQHLVGMIIGGFSKEGFHYPAEAYQRAFLILFVASIIAFICYLLPRDTNPLRQKAD